eukprot:m.262369 g.262369  ORF g.262369 m.262369 type:complete len:477 (+) comp45375_c0_seq1:162-1592(+)
MMFSKVVFVLASILLVHGDVAPNLVAEGPDIILTAGSSVGEITLQTSNSEKRVTLSQLSNVVSQLNQALIDVNNLKSTVVQLSRDLATCMNNTADLQNLTNGHQQQLLTIDGTLQQNAQASTTESARVDGILSSIGTIKTTQAESAEGVEFELNALSDRIDVVTNKTSVKCEPIGNLDANSVIHDSVTNIRHVVGFGIAMECKPGYAVQGVSGITCFPSGLYCDSADFPSATCTKQVELPTCKACPKGCSACLPNDGGCTACDKGSDLFILQGKCVKDADCEGYHNGGALQPGVNRNFPIVLKNNKTSTAGVCLVDDDDKVYEAIFCNELLNPGQSCIATSLSNQINTCTQNGYTLMSFRNKNHYKLMYKAFGAAMVNIVRTTGVHCKQNANLDPTRPYTRCAMNSKSNSACSRDWQVEDGGDWWLMENAYSEPNGDAKRYWYIDHGNFKEDSITINDGRGARSTGNLYLCIPRAK